MLGDAMLWDNRGQPPIISLLFLKAFAGQAKLTLLRTLCYGGQARVRISSGPIPAIRWQYIVKVKKKTRIRMNSGSPAEMTITPRQAWGLTCLCGRITAQDCIPANGRPISQNQ
jgi:hypothetical protein